MCPSILDPECGPVHVYTVCTAGWHLFICYPFQEGLSPLDLDKFSKGFGFPVGLATLADEVRTVLKSVYWDHVIHRLG